MQMVVNFNSIGDGFSMTTRTGRLRQKATSRSRGTSGTLKDPELLGEKDTGKPRGLGAQGRDPCLRIVGQRASGRSAPGSSNTSSMFHLCMLVAVHMTRVHAA